MRFSTFDQTLKNKSYCAELQLLCDARADIDAVDSDGTIALHTLIARFGIYNHFHGGAIKLLIDEKADVNKIDNHGRSLLSIAERNEQAAILIPMLLKRGCNPNMHAIFECIKKVERTNYFEKPTIINIKNTLLEHIVLQLCTAMEAASGDALHEYINKIPYINRLDIIDVIERGDPEVYDRAAIAATHALHDIENRIETLKELRKKNSFGAYNLESLMRLYEANDRWLNPCYHLRIISEWSRAITMRLRLEDNHGMPRVLSAMCVDYLYRVLPPMPD